MNSVVDLVGSLAAVGATVATAESLTGGLVVAALTSVPGSSAVVRGGVVAYATDLKATLAGVPTQTLARDGAVAASTARAMAAGVRVLCRAGYGVATTGVAGPGSQEGHPPGTVHVAVAGPSGVRSLSDRLVVEGRESVRAGAVSLALELLIEVHVEDRESLSGFGR